MNLYPFKFAPRFVEKMWGGRSLEAILGKTLPSEGLFGESWELFDFPPGSVGPDGQKPGDDPNGWISATISNGPLAGKSLHELMSSHEAALLGASKPVKTSHGNQFPLLIKFLDAQQDLSVQVHPSPEYAREHRDASLKNECWHVLSHEPGARLLIGTRPGVTRDAFRASLSDGTCEAKLNSIPVKLGETYYLPSGTVHALGAGILAAEVQTPSDTTYRVFDFERIEPKTGQKRTLHVDQAMACIDFEAGMVEPRIGPGRVVDAPQFTLDLRRASGEIHFEPGKARVLMVLEGTIDMDGTRITRGETCLIPGSIQARAIVTNQSVWLEATAE